MATPTEHVPPAIRQASSFLRTIYGQTPEKMEGIPHYEAARLIYHQNLNRSFSHRLSEKFACTSNIDQAADLECGRNTEDAAVSSLNETFPFLLLPREVRDIIYIFVLGGHFVHAAYDKDCTVAEHENVVPTWRRRTGLCHTLCVAEESEESIYKQFKAGKHDCWDRHYQCYPSRQWPQPTALKQLGLRLLRVCKQVFAETRLIPYSSNVFSIDGPSVLEKLAQQFLPDQISALRTLHLEVDLISDDYAVEWDRAMSHQKLIDFANQGSGGLRLRMLHLSFVQSFDSVKDYHTFMDLYPDSWVQGLLRLQKCPLTKVTAVVHVVAFDKREGSNVWTNRQLDHGVPLHLVKPDVLTLTVKQGYCERLVRRLLDRAQ